MGGEVYLTLSEVTSRLGVSEARVRQLITNGRLRAYRSGNRSLYRAEEVAELAGKLRRVETEVLEASDSSVSLLESLETTVSGEIAPKIGRTSIFTDQWIRKLPSRRPGRYLSTTILGWVVLIWGGAGSILGLHGLQRAMILTTEGKELALGVAGLYLFVKLCLFGIGLLMLCRGRWAFGLSLVTMFLAILEAALSTTMVQPQPIGKAVAIILLVTVVYLAVVLYLSNSKILRECGH